MDFLVWSGWAVAILSVLLNVWQYFKDRHRLVIGVRYIQSVNCYIIEVRNTGRRPITVTGAGIGGIPSTSEGVNVYVWSANDMLPQRLDEGDAKYLRVWWGDDVVNRNQALHAWVRDAAGNNYTVALPPVLEDGELPASSPARKVALDDLTKDQIAALYNYDIYRHDLAEIQRRLAPLFAEAEMYRMVGELRVKERQEKEARKRKSDAQTSP